MFGGPGGMTAPIGGIPWLGPTIPFGYIGPEPGTEPETEGTEPGTMGTSKPTVIDEDSDEDTSYDLLNSFVPETTNISKSKSAKKIKKNKYGPTKGKPPALVGWNHPKKQSDDCVIS